MKTLTDKQAMAGIRTFIDKYKTKEPYNAFIIAVADETGKVTLHPRDSQPCWGELRTYQEDMDGVEKPGDLHSPFPDGTPVGLGIPFRQVNPFLEFALTNAMSPWRNLVGKCELVKKDDGTVYGVIFTDTNFNSDILANFLFFCRMGYYRLLDATKAYPDITLLAEFLLVTCSAPNASGYGGTQSKPGYFTNGPAKYMNGEAFSFHRVVRGMPDVPNDWDFSSRAPYRRPLIECLWRDTCPDMPKAVPQFSGPEHTYGEPNPKLNTSLAAVLGVTVGEPTTVASLMAFLPKLEDAIVECLS